jgi:hypothetical protein
MDFAGSVTRRDFDGLSLVHRAITACGLVIPAAACRFDETADCFALTPACTPTQPLSRRARPNEFSVFMVISRESFV